MLQSWDARMESVPSCYMDRYMFCDVLQIWLKVPCMESICLVAHMGLYAHVKWEAKLDSVMVTLFVGNGMKYTCQTGESKNINNIRRILEVHMPGWKTKSWKETCQAGTPNPGNKHARLENQILETNMPELASQTLVCTFRCNPPFQEVLVYSILYIMFEDSTGQVISTFHCNHFPTQIALDKMRWARLRWRGHS